MVTRCDEMLIQDGRNRFVVDQLASRVQVAIDSGDARGLADLVERYWGPLIRTDDALLYRAIKAIPPDLLRQCPAAVLAAELFYPLNPAVREQGDVQISRTLQSFDTLADQQLRISRGTVVLVAMKRRGDFAAAARFGESVTRAAELAQTPTWPDDTMEALVVAAFLHAGIASLLACRLDEAEHQFSAAYRKRSPFPNHKVDAAGKLAVLFALRGESHLAENWLAHAEEVHRRTAADWRFGPQEKLGLDAAGMLLAVDSLDWPAFHRHGRAADQHEPAEMWTFVLYARARAAVVLGNQHGVIHQLNRYRDQTPELFSRGGLPQILLDTAEADLWMSLQQFDQARSLIERSGDHPLETATAVRFYLLTGRLRQAQARITPSPWPADSSRRDRLTLSLLAATIQQRLPSMKLDNSELLRGAAHEAAGDTDPWLLTFALTDPTVLGLIEQTIPDLRPVLAELAERNIHYPFLPHRAPTLTERERQLLELLVQDRQLADVAADLHIAAATARNHRKSLYRKLGATSRRQAIEIARHLGLLKV
jgi:DNA-binding CsgD family transcriptional regulator